MTAKIDNGHEFPTAPPENTAAEVQPTDYSQESLRVDEVFCMGE